MALNTEQQKLYDLAKSTLPKLLFENNELDPLKAAAVAYQFAWTYIQDLVEQTYILDAYGVYLDQHAIDNNLRRQNNESDAALRNRIRIFDDAQTRSAILTAVNAVLSVDGYGAAYLIELRAVQGHYNRGFYFSRGYRMGHSGRPNKLIIVVPYNTPAATVASIEDVLRVNIAAGKIYTIEYLAAP